jgi:nitrate/nitrite-specific signal transduction histidine kinase
MDWRSELQAAWRKATRLVRSPRRGLQVKILAWSFVPTAIILMAVAVVLYFAYNDVTEKLVVERNRQLTMLTASQFTSGLNEFVDLLDSLARTSDLSGDDPIVQRDGLKAASKRVAVFDGGVVLLDTFGTVVASQPERPEILGQNWSDRSYYAEVLHMEVSAAPGPVFSDLVADGPDGAQVIVVAVPVNGPQAEFRGILAGMFRVGATTTNAFYGDLIKLNLGQDGNAYLVDGQGKAIYHSDAARIGQALSGQPIVQQALRGQVGALRIRDLSGQEIVASYAPVPGTSWGLVAEESWTALFRSSRGYQQILVLLLGLGVVVPTLIVAVGVRRITQPITELIGAAQNVAEGNFGRTISAGTGDEIEELAEQFNRMSAYLQESYSTLERRVADRTKELSALNAIAGTVSHSLNLDEILNEALDKTLEVMEVEIGGIYLLDEATGILSVAVERGFSPEFVTEIDQLKIGEGFSGRVAESGLPLVVEDVAVDGRLTRTAVKDRGLHSLIVVPLGSKRRVLGTLFVMTHSFRQFGSQDVQLLTSIGNQIGVAVENAWLFEAESKRRQEAMLLAEIAKLTSGVLDLDQVLRLTAQYAVDEFDVDCCCIFFYNERRGTLKPAVEIGLDDRLNGIVVDTEFIPGQRLQQTVLESLQPLIIEDVAGEPYLSPSGLLDLQSALVVPIAAGQRCLGVLQLGTHLPRRRHFSHEEGELAMALANQAAMAIDNARLFKAEQRRADQFRVSSEVGRRITSLLEIDEVMNEVVRLIQQAFEYDHVGIALIEGEEAVYKVGAGGQWDEPGFEIRPNRLKIGQEGITGWVAASGEPLLVPDVSQDPRYVPALGSQTRSELTVPIKVKNQVIGVLDVESKRQDAFDGNDMALLQSLANQAAVALENARLYQQAQQLAVVEERNRLARDLHDAVTQTLFSASLIAEALPTLWERDQEEGRQLLQELRQLSRGALAEMRTLLMELRPAALVEANLGDLLHQLGEAVAGRTGIPVIISIDGRCELQPEVHVALYRIVQEALNNVVKHASARQVTISLSYTPAPAGSSQMVARAADLHIADDGRGFDPAQVGPDHLGLGIIHERAQSIGAALEIRSAPGQGTQISVSWEKPLKP